MWVCVSPVSLVPIVPSLLGPPVALAPTADTSVCVCACVERECVYDGVVMMGHVSLSTSASDAPVHTHAKMNTTLAASRSCSSCERVRV